MIDELTKIYKRVRSDRLSQSECDDFKVVLTELRKKVAFRVMDEDVAAVKIVLERFMIPVLNEIGVTVEIQELPISSAFSYGTTQVGDVLAVDIQVRLGHK